MMFVSERNSQNSSQVTLFNFVYVQTEYDLTHIVGATYNLPSGNSLFIIKYHIHEVFNCGVRFCHLSLILLCFCSARCLTKA